MANQPKKYQKFVATAATATLVATAVVPAASADAKFSDISKYSQDVQDEIAFLADLGVITGFEDGTFKPAQNITRGQTVKMLGRFLVENDYAEVPANWETEQSFEDIALNRTDRDLVKYAAVVKAAGVFKGDGNVLNPSGFTTRENMALILDRLAQQITGKTAVEIAKAAGVTGEVSDLAKAKEEAREAISALNALGISNANEFKPKTNTQRVHFASFLARAIELFEVKTPAIESVQALSKTKVVVTFNTPVDEVAKENFTIEGAKVDGVTLSEDKKTATLEVSGLEYATKYTVAIKDVKVDGKAVDFGSKEFTTPAVTQDFKLRVTPTATTVTADGADNTVVKFELLNSLGEVDTNADNMVLEIGSTFGNLANSRVTVQDGVGQVVLSSEFSTKEVIAKVTAQIIEASSDYKDLIGKVAGETTVKFVPASATTDPNAVTFQDAESNQADRVVLYFDKAVSPETFMKTLVTTDGTKKFVTEFDSAAGVFVQVPKNNVDIDISQDGDRKTIVGLAPVEGNDKAVEVILAKNDVLKDNAKVDLDVTIGTTNNKRSFTLTDARKPEFTGVTVANLRTLDLKFSESVAGGNFSIDGVLTEANGFDVEFGEFDAKTGVDKRDTATVRLSKDDKNKQRYFPAGQHSITVTQLGDFAAASDTANVSTTQTLNFNVVADPTAPTATVAVESPEQFRVAFNKDFNTVDGTSLTKVFNESLRVYDNTNKEWVTLDKLTTDGEEMAANRSNAVFNTTIEGKDFSELLTAKQASDKNGLVNEVVVELTSDWTKVLKNSTDAYYNYQFKFDIKAKRFENVTNGVTNVAFDLNLSEAGSALRAADNTSPVINDIVQVIDNASQFEIFMNEPVKLNQSATIQDDASNTASTSQTNDVPKVLAEFQGTDKAGKAVVIKAEVDGYSSLTDKSADSVFHVSTIDETLQSLVDTKGYGENWKVVVRSISDDIGNTAATLTKDFTVKASDKAPSLFEIRSAENGYAERVFAFDNTGKADRLEVTFTKGVNFAGNDNLTSVYNWTLNGKKLSELSNVAGIKLADADGNEKNGLEKVIITFADDKAFAVNSNVVSVTKGIKSLDGTALTGEFEVVAQTIFNEAANTADLEVAANFASSLLKIDLKKAPAAELTKLIDAYNALTENQKAAFEVIATPALEAKLAELKQVAKPSNEAPTVLAGSSIKVPVAIEKTVKDLGGEIGPGGIEGKSSITIENSTLPAEFEVTVDGVKAVGGTENGTTTIVADEEGLTENSVVSIKADGEERVTDNGNNKFTIKLTDGDTLDVLAANAKGELSEAAKANITTPAGTKYTVAKLSQANAIKDILDFLAAEKVDVSTLSGDYTVVLEDLKDSKLTTTYTITFTK